MESLHRERVWSSYEHGHKPRAVVDAKSQFSRVCIDQRNLLEARMVITTYNQHVRLLSYEPFGWFAPPKSTRAWEPTLFMESLHSPLLGGLPLSPPIASIQKSLLLQQGLLFPR